MMSAVMVREKTVIKLETSISNIDIEFAKGDKVADMAMGLLHALVLNVGVNGAKKLVDTKLATYDEDYPGLGK